MSRHEIFDEHGFNDLGILRFENRLEIDRVQIAALFGKIATLIEDVSNAAAHAGGKISPAGSKHQHQTPSHVFAAVAANALHHSGCPGGANANALARESV